MPKRRFFLLFSIITFGLSLISCGDSKSNDDSKSSSEKSTYIESSSETETSNNTSSGELSSSTELDPDIYKITFNSNGGTKIDNQYINVGEKVTKPDTPIKNPSLSDTFTFDAWYLDKDCKELFNFDSYEVQKNITLYANWIATPFVTLDNFVFELNDDELSYSLEKFIFPENIDRIEVTIPSEYNGLPVTTIGGRAFSKCWGVVSVSIPNSVTTICSSAFYGCLINSITIPSSVTTIDSFALSCPTLREVYNLTNIDLKSNNIFSDSGGLLSMYYPSIHNDLSENSILSINDDKFVFTTICGELYLVGYYGNDSEVILPKSINYDGKIYDTYTVGPYTFERCKSIKSIVIPDEARFYYTEKNKLFSSCEIEKIVAPAEFLKASTIVDTSTKEIIISSGEYIPSEVFRYCKNLEKIILPDDLKYVEVNAFIDCSQVQYNEYENAYYLGSLNNPYLCLIKAKSTDIKELTIHDDCKIICDEAFKDCMFDDIILPDNITHIGYNAITLSPSLKDGTIIKVSDIEIKIIDIDGELYFVLVGNESEKPLPLTEQVIQILLSENHELINYGSGYFGTDDNPFKFLVKYCDNSEDTFIINERCEYINSKAFESEKLNNILIPKSVKRINSDAFNKTTINNIYYDGTIEDWCNIEFINMYSNPMNNLNSSFYILDSNGNVEFNGNKYSLLTNLEIPDSINKIGRYQFYGFSMVRSINIPNSVTLIDKYAFSCCKSVDNINIPSSVRRINEYAFCNCFSISSLILNNKVFIEDYAFDGCISLCEVYDLADLDISLSKSLCPNNYGCIGYYAYIVHKSLSEKSIMTVDDKGFRYACFDGKAIIVKYVGNDNTVIIPEEITYDGKTYSEFEILSYAFENCTSIEKIVINNNITKFDKKSLNGCSFNEVYFNGTIEDWINVKMGDYTNPESHTDYFYVLDPNGTKDYNGNKYSLLSDLVIPQSVEKIDRFHFYFNDSIVNLTISEGVKEIDGYVFYGCSNLTNITIPKSLTKVGYNAFSVCSSLTNVFYDGTLEDWLKINFSNEFSFEPNDYGLTIGVGSSELEYNPLLKGTNFYILDSNGTKEYNGKKYSLLENIIVPNTVTEINAKYFGFTNTLKSIVIGSSVTKISEGAFKDCTLLSIVTISNSVTEIDYAAFYNCTSLNTITFTGTKEEWNSIRNGINYYSTSIEKIICSNGEIIIKDGDYY